MNPRTGDTGSESILFCGGGSMGHIAPSLAILEAIKLRLPGAKATFICSTRSDETASLRASGVAYHSIHAGKFPRGFSFRIFTFPILFVVSLVQSFMLLPKIRPRIIVSKGGFVSVPVCIAGAIRQIPIVLHMSDSVASLSDRFIGRLASVVCTGFSVASLPSHLRIKAVQTGNPVRDFISKGSPLAGQRITNFSGRRPVVMIIGGSQGSVAINRAVAEQFAALIDLADVIHITGEGKEVPLRHARYFSRSYVHEELKDLYAIADVVVTRAGAGILSELALLSKAAIVIPLSGVAHDHQVRNAEALRLVGACELLKQENIGMLTQAVKTLLSDDAKRENLGRAIHTVFPPEAARNVADAILDVIRHSRIEY